MGRGLREFRTGKGAKRTYGQERPRTQRDVAPAATAQRDRKRTRQELRNHA